MAIKIPKGYRVISGISKESLDTYIQSFTFGSGETILVGRSDTLDLTITRGTRTSDGAGNALQIQGGQATGTNQVGGHVNIYTGYPTGNAAAGDFKVLGALVNGSSGTSVNPSNSTMFSVSGDTGDATFANDITIGGDRITNQGSDNNLSIVSDGNIYFEIDQDADEASKFSFAKHSSSPGYAEVASIDESGNLQIDGGLTIGSTEIIDSSGNIAASSVKQIVVTHHHFFMNSSSTTADFFFPYNNLNEASSTSQYYTRTIAPYAGKIIKVLIRPSAGIGTACKLQFHKITDTTLNFGTAVEEVTNVNLNTAETSVSTAFSSATFSAGDVVNVSLIKSDSATANIQAVIVWEYTV